MIILGENVTAILLTPHCNSANNGAVVLGSVRREADVERRRRWRSGRRAEAIINNWELIKVPDKSMEPVACVSRLSSSFSQLRTPFGLSLAATRVMI